MDKQPKFFGQTVKLTCYTRQERNKRFLVSSSLSSPPSRPHADCVEACTYILYKLVDCGVACHQVTAVAHYVGSCLCPLSVIRSKVEAETHKINKCLINKCVQPQTRRKAKVGECIVQF